MKRETDLVVEVSECVFQPLFLTLFFFQFLLPANPCPNDQVKAYSTVYEYLQLNNYAISQVKQTCAFSSVSESRWRRFLLHTKPIFSVIKDSKVDAQVKLHQKSESVFPHPSLTRTCISRLWVHLTRELGHCQEQTKTSMLPPLEGVFGHDP